MAGQWEVASEAPAPAQPASGNQWEVASEQPAPVDHEPVTHEMSNVPGGPTQWLKNLEGDIRYGSGNTIVGRALKAMGAKGVNVGAQAQAGDTIASVPLGAVKMAQGVTEGGAFTPEGRKDLVGGAVQAATIPASFVAPEAGEAAAEIPGKVAGAAKGVVNAAKEVAPGYLKSADELAGTTPERISELKTVPQKMAAVHKLAVDTEASAKAAAKASYPDVKTPVVRTHVQSFEDPNPLSPGAEEAPVPSSTRVVQEKVPFKQVQEQYAELGQQIAKEKRAVKAGAKPAYDLEDMAKKYGQLSDEMREAAQKDGKLAEFNAAQAKWRQFMDDFHNPGSAVKPLTDMKPDQTSGIVNHILNNDKGARTLKVLRKYGADTSGVEKIMSRGSTPLKVDVTESSKLQKAGSDSNYRAQRLNESMDQLTTTRMPSKTEARIPKMAASGTAPGILEKIPGADTLISPRTVTKAKLSRALKNTLSGKP